MSAIENSTSSATMTGSIEPSIQNTDHSELKDSIADIINALTGSNKTGAKLQNERLSEDLLYAALLHSKLKNIDPELAKQFLTDLARSYRHNTTQNVRQPIFRAAEKALREIVKDGRLTKSEKQDLAKYAFGKAQLDDRETRLTREVKPLVNQFDEKNSRSNIEAILEKVSSNEVATGRTLTKFKDRIKDLGKLTPQQALRQRNFLDDIDPKGMPVGSSIGTTNTPASSNKLSGDIPQPKDIQSGPDDFVFLPQDQSGNLIIHIPVSYSERVDKVTLYAENGDKLGDLVFDGFGTDGRSQWHLEGGLGDYSGNIYAGLHLISGANIKWSIGAAKEYQSYKVY